jgi:hypothetical protein
VTDQGQHLADDTLSSLVDQQLAHAELARAQSHVQSCAECQVRLNELSSVVSLLRVLPTVALPRDFCLATQPSPAADLRHLAQPSPAADFHDTPQPSPAADLRLAARPSPAADFHLAAQPSPAADLRLDPPLEGAPVAPSRLRLLADPPNVIRLRRWYAVARAGAASLAAAFVFLSVGALYEDSRPASSTVASGVARSQDASSQPGAVPAASPPAVAVRAAAPAAQSAPAAPNAGAARPQNAAPATNNDTAAGQTAAATSVRALPTPLPTLPPLRPSSSSSPPPQTTAPTFTNSAAPLRVAAALVGALAALGLLLTLVVRHRLKAATP